MKKIYKILVFSLLLAFAFSCDQGDGRFGDNISTSGWIEFRSASSSTTSNPTAIEIPLSINVPVYQNGINITYSITAVQGDYTEFVNSTGGTIFVDPTNVSREASISLPFQNGDVYRCESIIFDVNNVSEDVDGVGIGVDNDSNVTHRVTIVRSDNNPPSDFFVGDYELEDVLATVGPGNGTDNLENTTVTLSIDPSNPNARIFNTRMIPAFVPTVLTASIDFSNDVVTLGDLDSGIGCGGPGTYMYVEAGADNTAFDVCDGDDTILVTYIEDPTGACGGPYPASFTLTKL